MNKFWLLSLGIFVLGLSACTDNGLLLKSSGEDYITADVNGIYKIGTPYQVSGVWYYPKEDYDYKEVGIASWYGPDFHKGLTANGETYNMHGFTAAHRTLPLPSVVKVTNLDNGKFAIVRVNDRGPFVNNRVIDVSKNVAEKLDFIKQGTAKVRVEILAEESQKLKEQILKNGGRVVGTGDLAESPILAQDGVSLLSTETPIALAGAVVTEDIQNPYIDELKTEQEPENEIIYQPKKQEDSVFKTVPESGYFVQIAAFSNQQNAIRLMEKLQKNGKAFILRKDAPSGTIYRVRMGPFEKADDGVALMDNLAKEGYPDTRLIQEM